MIRKFPINQSNRSIVNGHLTLAHMIEPLSLVQENASFPSLKKGIIEMFLFKLATTYPASRTVPREVVIRLHGQVSLYHSRFSLFFILD